jgi:addiction module RelE/StbE family toxin
VYQIDFSEIYLKKLEKFLKKHPALKNKYSKTTKLLKSNPYYPSLKLHKLSGNLKDCHSVYIDNTYRIILIFEIQEKTITLLDVGHHKKVY